jgi:hypothetical protein
MAWARRRQADCLKTPRLLNDNKTFVLLCTTLPGKTYAMALNPGRGRRSGLQQPGRKPRRAQQLTFTTGTGEPVTKLRDAIKAAGLGDLDVPVEEAPELPKAKP